MPVAEPVAGRGGKEHAIGREQRYDTTDDKQLLSARSSICTAPARAHPRPDNRDEEKPIHRLTRPQVSTSPQCFPLPQRGTAHTAPGAARRGALSAVRARPVA
ncbi:hypothetical protein VFPFJ_03759 [Purpureocillium lilacinum]|uniref:Uncharacterized protein n=1 Tax=Purpureocillium lilacinum TaxID=33203 RepID=A0A179GVH9_PURLI|nr:hypothetical protein VFPFJ_03759 [Purpureocillium lilacinum]OAQ81965.1 hypothetical protein VFPBJ_04549 [Purpureocillium lilacinum]OAQ92019.1 hypothetical protein VFPFJ_03759 [Purpureocillium lilacinum]